MRRPGRQDEDRDVEVALNAVIGDLTCPHDRGGLWLDGRVVGCPQGHRFDVARQGHLNLLVGPAPAAADTAAMVAARVEVQRTDLLSPVTRAVAAAVASAGAPDGGLTVDVGAGTGHHLAAAIDARPGTAGLAVDLSKYAARRAARCHFAVAAVVADIWAGLPVRDGAAAIVLNVFAPRSPEEFARVLVPGGLLVVVTPEPDHLCALVDALGLLRTPAGKTDQIDQAVAPAFELTAREALRWSRQADASAIVALVASGPSAHHVDLREVRRRAMGPDLRTVDGAVTVSVYRRR